MYSREPARGLALIWRVGPPFEAGKALQDVGVEARACLLAVIDHVDTTGKLGVDDIPHSVIHYGSECGAVDDLTALLAPEPVEQRSRAADAAGMRGKDSFSARLHFDATLSDRGRERSSLDTERQLNQGAISCLSPETLKDPKMGSFRFKTWWRERDSNPRPSGYEPDELPLLHPASVIN